jgi:hypothetical protein
VVDLKTFGDYARQTIGIPYPTKQKFAAAQKAANRLFDMYPRLTWQGLCGTVDWAKAKKKRFSQLVILINYYDQAWADGYLPELDPESEADFAQRILDAIEEETDPTWRRRLLTAYGEGAQLVWEQWEEQRKTKLRK